MEDEATLHQRNLFITSHMKGKSRFWFRRMWLQMAKLWWPRRSRASRIFPLQDNYRRRLPYAIRTSITSQMEEEVTILVEQNEAPAFQVVVAAAILYKQDFSHANQVGEDAMLRQQNFL